MKIAFNFSLLLVLIIIVSTGLTAQTTATWQGGTPGRSTDWNCASNWNENRTPDEFSLVIIPSDRHFYPVITAEADPIDALLIESGAALTLSDNANLTVLGETGRMGGMILFGTIQNQGIIDLRFESNATIRAFDQINGNGLVYGFDQDQLASLRINE